MTATGAASEVGAVVVSYETRERTLRCVASALAEGARVAVVDNASRDGTAATVRETFGGRVTLIANARNAGFGAACNQGAAALAGARWLLFLNADTEVTPGAAAALVAAGEAHPDAAILGPSIVGDAGAAQASVRGHPTRLALLHQHTALRFLRVGARAFERYRNPPAGDVVPVVMGAAMLARAEDFAAASTRGTSSTSRTRTSAGARRMQGARSVSSPARSCATAAAPRPTSTASAR